MALRSPGAHAARLRRWRDALDPLAAGLLAGLAAFILGTLAWLWPRAGVMRWPVVAYGLAIGNMLWLAQGVDRVEVRLGALLFVASDLAVARDRFVRPGLANRAVGLPLYDAAQVLLALAVR
jgi:uncharacterized membrane protein YhhN